MRINSSNTGVNGGVLGQFSTNVMNTVRGKTALFSVAVFSALGLADNTNAQQVAMVTPGSGAATSTNTGKVSNASINNTYEIDAETKAEVREYRAKNGEYEGILATELVKSKVFLEFIEEHMPQMEADGADHLILGPTSKAVGHYHVWLQKKTADRTLEQLERDKYQAQLDKLPLAVDSNRNTGEAGNLLKGVHLKVNHDGIEHRFDIGWIQNGKEVLNGLITNIEHGDEINVSKDDYAIMQTAARRNAMVGAMVRYQQDNQKVAANR